MSINDQKGHDLWHTPEGVRDIYGNGIIQRNRVLARMQRELSDAGYEEMVLPAFEFSDVFSGDIGTTPDREMYKFFDRDGNTLALRPDFTPSVARCVAKYYTDVTDPIRISYHGSAYVNRQSTLGLSGEMFELGAELYNDASVGADAEMIALLINQLKSAGLARFEISIGNTEYFRGLCEAAGLDHAQELTLRELLSGKNYYSAEAFLKELGFDKKKRDPFLELTGFLDDGESLRQVLAGTENDRCRNALARLIDIYEILKAEGLQEYISFDLSLLGVFGYYTGVIFRGFTYGVGDAIASGGRYDNLLSKFGKDAPAVGFMIQMDLMLEALNSQDGGAESDSGSPETLTIALTKGRLAEKTMALLTAAGYDCSEILDGSRKLVFEDSGTALRFFMAKGPDVPTYVEYGAADIGVTGSDVIMEENRRVYEVLDLGFGKCRMCVCGPESARDLLLHHEKIRVATKYPRIARDYFYNSKNQTIDIIGLGGSVELGPIVGLSDVIVDIVETGSTLRENGLDVLEEVASLSARMIVNPVSMQMKSERIRELIRNVRAILE